MRVLVLGGTQFIGRHIAETLVAGGHRVSVLNRGVTPDPLPAAVERIRGDRDAADAGLGALAGRSWDACVDVSGYTARQLRPGAERLRDRVGHYLFVSAVSVYARPARRPVTEGHARLPAAGEAVTVVDADTYGPLKVTCENIVREIYPGRCTLLRPQIVVGPHDPTHRYSRWVRRAARGGPMLAPGDGSDHLQVIDVRDLARFAAAAVERRMEGVFNVAGPRLTWAAFLELLGAREPAWVPAAILRAAGLTEQELPLYREEQGERSWLMDIDSERARAAGLSLTAPETTLRDTREWLRGRETPPVVPPELEAELIRRARGG